MEQQTITQKLATIQQKLKAPKGQYNSFGKYAYRNAEDILEAVKPLCAETGTLVLLSDEIMNIGNRFYVKATAALIDAETQTQLTVSAYAREEEEKKGMDGSQVTGASSSYARKYALNGLFAIDDTKDSDTTNTTGTDKTAVKGKQTPLVATKEQLAEAAALGVNLEQTTAWYNKKMGTVLISAQLPYDVVQTAITKKKEALAKAEAQEVFA
jgi:hypothetical protein